MFATAITARPIYAFGAAFVGCGGYFLVLFGTLTMLKATLNPALYLCLVAVPVLACGYFHHTVTRDAAIRRLAAGCKSYPLRLALRSRGISSGFAFVIATGKGSNVALRASSSNRVFDSDAWQDQPRAPQYGR